MTVQATMTSVNFDLLSSVYSSSAVVHGLSRKLDISTVCVHVPLLYLITITSGSSVTLNVAMLLLTLGLVQVRERKHRLS